MLTARRWETNNPGKAFTFLTVTNKGAHALNRRCLQLHLGLSSDELDEKMNSSGLIGDPQAGVGGMFFEVGMRIRLTRNLDKDRGFVNGAVGVIEMMLIDRIFVLRTPQDVRLLVHPIVVDRTKFMPCSYAYALTIRRAQGSTLDAACLYFDQGGGFPAERGYGYVGASRVRFAKDLYLCGRMRTSDWLPVGAAKADEHLVRGEDSTTDEDGRSTDEESDSELELDNPEEDFFCGPDSDDDSGAGIFASRLEGRAFTLYNWLLI